MRDWVEYQQPNLGDYNVSKPKTVEKTYSLILSGYFTQISIQMPSLKSLRILCDKMKNLAPTMTICCISSGDLSFIVETDSSIVVSRYFNLILDHVDDKSVNKDGQPSEICCQIDTKQLSTCFGSIQVDIILLYKSTDRSLIYRYDT